MVFKNDQLLNYPASISNEPHELRRAVKTYIVSNLCAQHLHRERERERDALKPRETNEFYIPHLQGQL